MTVTFPDARNLRGTDAAMLFSASLDVVFVNMTFVDDEGEADWPEEPVYRDGAFVGRYAALSTKVGASFSVRRDGGWPRHPAPRVEEAAAPATGGQAMGAIYEVDLTAQSSQSMTIAGSYTIDGHTWWAKGVLSPGKTCDLVSGKGLTFTMPSGNWDGDATSDGKFWFSENQDYALRVLGFPIAQLANYNPAAPLFLAWRIESPNAPESGGTAFAGYMSTTASATGVTAAEKGSVVSVFPASGTSYWVARDMRFNLRTSFSPTEIANTLNGGLMGLYRVTPGRCWPLARVHTGSLFYDWTPEAMVGATDNIPPYATGADPANPWFFFVAQKSFVGVALDVSLTQLKIMQPRVA